MRDSFSYKSRFINRFSLCVVCSTDYSHHFFYQRKKIFLKIPYFNILLRSRPTRYTGTQMFPVARVINNNTISW